MLTLTDIQPQKNEIYLDNNATTPVLPQAAEAAMHAMKLCYGNPSSSHITGIKAKYILETSRSLVRDVIGAKTGNITFTSGATEGIQTAIISALENARHNGKIPEKSVLLYGATEHKAVPETLKHWNKMLNIGAEVVAIPVDEDGILDHDFIRDNVADALIICTMAANNETGVYQDLEVLGSVIRSGNPDVLWMVDCVQALGKMSLDISNTSIDYAPFSGHKLYAPKGIGILYVRDGAPFTPFIAGGGQESGLRSGTENLPGIAALQAILALLSDPTDDTFKSIEVLNGYREQLSETLREAFPAIVFNHDFSCSLPTTLNFSVKGLSSKEVMDLFDAAHIRVSSGSACSSKTTRSFVLDAMAKPTWQSDSAIRMSFGPATTQQEIDQACTAIKRAVKALQHSCLILSDTQDNSDNVVDGLQQWVYDQQSTWCYIDKTAGQCIAINMQAELVSKFETLVSCQNFQVNAVLESREHDDLGLSSEMVRKLISKQMQPGIYDSFGWNQQYHWLSLDDQQKVQAISVGSKVLANFDIAGLKQNTRVYLLGTANEGKLHAANIEFAFVGDSLAIDGLSPGKHQGVEQMYHLLTRLNVVIAQDTLICPSLDSQQLFSTSLAREKLGNKFLANALETSLPEAEFFKQKDQLDSVSASDNQGSCVSSQNASDSFGHIEAKQLADFMRQNKRAIVVDVREPHEFIAYPEAGIAGEHLVNMPLTQLSNFVLQHRHDKQDNIYICICRSGNRSVAAAKALIHHGFDHVYHVPGGYALLN
jgi:cysteine desulfurase